MKNLELKSIQMFQTQSIVGERGPRERCCPYEYIGCIREGR